MKKETICPKEELKFCLELWEKQGGCNFGGGKKCTSCGASYLLWKMITGEVIHEDVSLEDWKTKISSL